MEEKFFVRWLKSALESDVSLVIPNLPLSHMTLEGIHARNVTFKGVKMYDIRFVNSLFEGCRFIRCSFQSVTFVSASFKKSPLQCTSFRDSCFGWVKMFGGELEDCVFRNCRSGNLDLNQCAIMRTLVAKCSLKGLHTTESNFRDVRFERCSIVDGAHTDSYFRDAALIDCRVTYNTYEGVTFDRCCFPGTDVERLLGSVRFVQSNLSGQKLKPAGDILNARFESDEYGVIVYKMFGDTFFPMPQRWILEPGRFITEFCDDSRSVECGCGVNFGTKEWCVNHINSAGNCLWKCRIRWKDLPGVVVPYEFCGKARCDTLELVEEVPEDQWMDPPEFELIDLLKFEEGSKEEFLELFTLTTENLRLKVESLGLPARIRSLPREFQILWAADKYLGTYGVETFSISEDERNRISYCNIGQTYDATLVYIHDEQKFEVTSWGDLVEEYENTKSKEENEDENEHYHYDDDN